MIHRSSTRFRELIAVAATALLAVPLAFTAAAPAAAATAGGTVEGTVSGDGAGLLADVTVSAIGEDGYQDSTATTDTAGDYRLDLDPGTYRLLFSPAEGSPWSAELWKDASTLDEATQVVVTTGSSTTADARLVEGSTISGRVTCGGAPIGGISVSQSLRSNQWVGRGTTTAADGTYRITGVVPGDHEVVFQGSGDCIGEPWTDDDLGGYATPVTVRAGENRRGIDADLVLGGSITGTIRDVSGGLTTGQVLVHAPSATGGPGPVVASFPASSGDGGYYTVNAIPEGDYFVQYDAWDGSIDQWHPDATTSAGATLVHVDSGIATTGVDFTAVPGATISGTVGGYYTPNSFLQITATPVDAPAGEGVQVTVVEKDGSYSIPFLALGEYIVSAPSLRDDSYTALTKPQWYRNADTVAGAVPVKTTGTATTDGIDFTLRAVGSTAPTTPAAPPGTISGTVTAPADVPGEHRYYVAAYDLDTIQNSSPVPAAEAELVLGSGETGAYTLSDEFFGNSLEVGGSYRVRVVEDPSDRVVPEVGDEYWKNADRFDDATVVRVPSGPGVTGIDFSLSAYAFTSTRIAGEDRYGTSVASTQVFGPGVPVLYIASGEKWADALSAAPAAGSQDGALLLTDPRALPADVAAEITRLAPKRTIIVGSELTISDAVYKQIDALVGDTTRIGGIDRYDTSRKIVDDAYPDFSDYNLILATGNNFPDALSVAPVAGREYYLPVLLVDGAMSRLDAETRAAIERLDPSLTTVLGRTDSISAGIEQELESSGFVHHTQRIGGSDRYETSRLINEEWQLQGLMDTTYLASGENFADALAGATAAAAENVSISLSRPDCVPGSTVDSLKRSTIDTVKILGSERTLSRGVDTVTAC